MKKITLIVVILFCVLFVSKTNAQYFDWAKRIGPSNYDCGVSAEAITTDEFKNIYTVGILYSGYPMDFDPGPGVYDLPASGGDQVFISKLDSSGNFLWAKSFGGNGVMN